MQQGLIFNIQRYSIHDGPGIRTTVFFKGCPLNCWWCHNPESQAPGQEIIYYQDRCSGCGACVRECPEGARRLVTESGAGKNGESGRAGIIIRDAGECRFCGNCIESCPAGALEMVGGLMTVEEIIEEVERDTIFYDQSGGGVTLSGGEPLGQAGLLKGLAAYFHQTGISVALDTCGYAPPEALAQIAPEVDFFLYDLKFIESERHRKYTGVGNELILDNLERLSCPGKNNYQILGRIPLIPGINDDRENIEGIGRIFLERQVDRVNLLPYHNTGSDKYNRLGREYKLSDLEALPQERIDDRVDLLKGLGLQVKVGG